MTDYEQHQKLKKEVWKIIDQIEELNITKALIGLSNKEQLELDNLRVKMMNKWSELKD